MVKSFGAAQSDSEALAQVSVYLPHDLLARLRKQAKRERRSLSAQIVLQLERYEKDQSVATAGTG